MVFKLLDPFLILKKIKIKTNTWFLCKNTSAILIKKIKIKTNTWFLCKNTSAILIKTHTHTHTHTSAVIQKHKKSYHKNLHFNFPLNRKKLTTPVSNNQKKKKNFPPHFQKQNFRFSFIIKKIKKNKNHPFSSLLSHKSTFI